MIYSHTPMQTMSSIFAFILIFGVQAGVSALYYIVTACPWRSSLTGVLKAVQQTISHKENEPLVCKFY